MHLNMYPFHKMYLKFKPIPSQQEQEMYLTSVDQIQKKNHNIG
jgi:hypothetical protein